MLLFYGYKKCSTCLKAEKALKALEIEYRFIDITLHPPTADILQQTADFTECSLRKLFNTSGKVYREMQLKTKLNEMSQSQQLALLCANGRLIKRPLVCTASAFSIGYHPETFHQVWAG